MKQIRNWMTLCVLLLISLKAITQNNGGPFWPEIQQFIRMDSLKTPPENANLFVGSSSFRMWKGLQDSFPDYEVINRGFGGSALPDIIRYSNQTILKYNPAQVIVYCGDNDLASSDTVSAEIVYERFLILFSIIRKKYPDVAIAFVSMKPSPSRWRLKNKYIEGNQLIKDFLVTRENANYIDVWSPMLDASGNPDKDLFLSDNLHMNAKGYALWKDIIEPYLIKKGKEKSKYIRHAKDERK